MLGGMGAGMVVLVWVWWTRRRGVDVVRVRGGLGDGGVRGAVLAGKGTTPSVVAAAYAYIVFRSASLSPILTLPMHRAEHSGHAVQRRRLAFAGISSKVARACSKFA